MSIVTRIGGVIRRAYSSGAPNPPVWQQGTPLKAGQHLDALRMSEEPGRELSQDLKYWSSLEGTKPAPNSTYNTNYERTDSGKRKALSSTWYRRTNEVGRYVTAVSVVFAAALTLWYVGKDKLIDVELDPQMKRNELLLKQQQQVEQQKNQQGK